MAFSYIKNHIKNKESYSFVGEKWWKNELNASDQAITKNDYNTFCFSHFPTP